MTSRSVLCIAFVLTAFWATTTRGQTQIVPQAELARMKSILPKLDDEFYQGILDDPTTMWYTSRSMPSAFQFMIGNGYLPTNFYYSNKNFSGDLSDAPLGDGRGGNANCEFPWSQKPGGAHRSPYVDSFKALWLPKKPDGRPYPVVWFRQRLPGREGGGRVVGPQNPEGGPSPYYNFEYGYGWRFPVGSVFTEVLTTRDPQGYYVVFEVRFRIREKDDWGVDVFRPFLSPEDLVARIKTLRPDWQQNQMLVSAVNNLTATPRVTTQRLVDSRHTKEYAFDRTAGIVQLPPLPADLVNELLVLTKFQSALGSAWASSKGQEPAFAPSNETNAHNIVTSRYDGTFVGTDRTSCIDCHNSANHHATRFEAPRGWYGRVRGSDGILSWHPVSPQAISYNGSPIAVQLRGEFVRDGVLERYDSSRHSSEMYNSIEGLY